MRSYRISGLTVASDMELPGAIATAFDGTAEVTVRFGEVPHTLPGAAELGPNWQMLDDVFVLTVPRLARMLIARGRDITVQLEPGETPHDASGFVLGSAFGILLHQRGAMALHGASVARGGRAIVVCGHSGAGKSTLATALCRQGCEFVADDICAITPGNPPHVLPDGRQLKLWQQSIAALDMADAKGAAVRGSFEKYFIEPPATAADPPVLSAIYILREAKPPLKQGFEQLSLPDAVRALDWQAYRPGLRNKIGQKPALLMQAATVLGHTPVFFYTRPRSFEVFDGTVTALLEHWDSL